MYEAHKWKIGEEITSEKLNHIEKGIEEAGLPREITDPQDGQTLKYDAAKGKWVNGEGGGGSSILVVNATTDSSTDITTLDKTWQEIFDAFPNVLIKRTVHLPVGDSTEFHTIMRFNQLNNTYGIFIDDEDIQFFANGSNGYPSTDDGSSRDPVG